MGWGSAGGLFNDIVHAMIDGGVHGDNLTDICEKIIRQFQEGDWDTEEESLEAFDRHPDVVEAFRRCGIHPHGTDDLKVLFRDVFDVRGNEDHLNALVHTFLPAMQAAVRNGGSHFRVDVIPLTKVDP